LEIRVMSRISQRVGSLRVNSFVYNSHFVADIISTVEFDHTGDYLATGDKGGRVVLFERNEQVGLQPDFADN
jgi:hypothetical protein